MIQDIWCPSEVSKLTKVFGTTGLQLAIVLNPPFPWSLYHTDCNEEHHLLLKGPKGFVSVAGKSILAFFLKTTRAED